MPKRELPPNEKVIELYESGMSSGEIAEKYGVKPVTVISLLRRIGHPRRSIGEATRLAEKKGRRRRVRYWLGKKQPPEMVEKRTSKIRGSNHYLWKGGRHRRGYRGMVEKVECAECGARINLGVHHKNFDHYDNDPENLQVLCVSCHMSVHKQAYWDAIHEGREPPKSNGPVGWQRGNTNDSEDNDGGLP